MKLINFFPVFFALTCAAKAHAGLFRSSDASKCGRENAVKALVNYFRSPASGLLQPALRTIEQMKLGQQILPVLSQQLLAHMAAKQRPHPLTLSGSEEEEVGLEFDHRQGVYA
ncbi:hypothetical protein MHZ90_19825 [Pantoea sp. ACRSH]|uniref:hypothetical protein n=1 Tax=unclassified Pantoea TaxID=2630326 RepID=UPI001EF4D018|nr:MULTISPECIES: hypothetical protein [unclassified Pantoea]MCG7368352.1 hypothetical protein [Pantoea sp. ACRSH]MCG7398711.1 hypothetical protein [Pantoea sp. ACRSC]